MDTGVEQASQARDVAELWSVHTGHVHGPESDGTRTMGVRSGAVGGKCNWEVDKRELRDDGSRLGSSSDLSLRFRFTGLLVVVRRFGEGRAHMSHFDCSGLLQKVHASQRHFPGSCRTRLLLLSPTTSPQPPPPSPPQPPLSPSLGISEGCFADQGNQGDADDGKDLAYCACRYVASDPWFWDLPLISPRSSVRRTPSVGVRSSWKKRRFSVTPLASRDERRESPLDGALLFLSLWWTSRRIVSLHAGVSRRWSKRWFELITRRSLHPAHESQATQLAQWSTVSCSPR